MPDYSKALSTYKKINKIKSSALNITKAKQDINERKIKAVRKNEKLGRKKRIFNAISNLAVTGGAVGASELNLISGEDARNYGAGASGVLSILNESINGTVKNAGALGQDASVQAHRNNTVDIAGNALGTYNVLDSNLQRKKGVDVRNSVKRYAEGKENISEDEIMTFLDTDDVNFKQGEGYEITPENIIAALRKKGNFLKDSGMIDNADDFVESKGFNTDSYEKEETNVGSQNKYDF